jgi:8-oxo-dGTP pyrophosphatase MutT (NUDIX family)
VHEHLRQLLRRYQPSADEIGFHAAMLELLERGERAFRRDEYDPGHFTASAFVLSPDRDALLLILHQKLGLWLQPGGHLEPEDGDVVAAARRELGEEVGLADAELLDSEMLDIDVHRIPPSSQPAHRHFDVRFLFRAHDRRLTAQSDAVAARWVPLAEVPSATSDASVQRAIARIIARV